MRWFLERYREGSRLSRRAFWVVVVCALLGLATVPLQRWQDSGGPWSWLSDAVTILMFVGLVVQGVSLRRDTRRRRRTSS